jgi:hypothetical protein
MYPIEIGCEESGSCETTMDRRVLQMAEKLMTN